MTATEERNKPVDGRDVARRLRETGALDGLFEQIDSGDVEMTGARGLLPALLKEVPGARPAGRAGRAPGL